ncbi:30S ribosomal protein S10 [Patescibacteria group bacterium]|nr:30S ribosomal protein S10 [Patescibacteria group bacterium]
MAVKKMTKEAKTAVKKAAPRKKVAAKTPAAKTKTAPVAKTKTAASKKKAESVQKLRIKVRAYEHKILDASVKQIIDTAIRYDAHILGPIPLPTEMKKYTVNRSPFIFKNAREQFEMRVHKRLIDILNPSPKVIEALTNLNLPSGVNIDVKMM